MAGGSRATPAPAFVAAAIVTVHPEHPALVPSIRDAINRTGAKLVYVANIMTEVGETDGFSAYDHVQALTRHGVRAPDVVLVNNAPIDPERMKNYITEGAQVVEVPEEVVLEIVPHDRLQRQSRYCHPWQRPASSGP